MLQRILFVTALLGIGILFGLGVIGRPEAQAEEVAKPGKQLRHVVLFKFKAETTAAKLAEIEEAFRGLPRQIDTIVDFEWGTDVSPENLADGFTHCFLVTFADLPGRDAYLPHPAHKKFIDLIKPHLEKVLVVDYWSRT